MEFRATRRRQRSPRPQSEPEPASALIGLAYELLDAHADTARLALEGAGEDEWRLHLDYLTDLQRVGREALAHADARRR